MSVSLAQGKFPSKCSGSDNARALPVEMSASNKVARKYLLRPLGIEGPESWVIDGLNGMPSIIQMNNFSNKKPLLYRL